MSALAIIAAAAAKASAQYKMHLCWNILLPYTHFVCERKYNLCENEWIILWSSGIKQPKIRLDKILLDFFHLFPFCSFYLFFAAMSILNVPCRQSIFSVRVLLIFCFFFEVFSVYFAYALNPPLIKMHSPRLLIQIETFYFQFGLGFLLASTFLYLVWQWYNSIRNLSS